MISFESSRPVVPDQLVPLMDQDVLAVHERWQSVDLHDIRQAMPQPTVIDVGKCSVRAVVMDPQTKDVNENHTLVLGLPHQQAWKPSMYIRSKMLQDIVAPNSRLVVFPNNTIGDRYYDLTKDEQAKLSAGDISPYAEMQLRVLQTLKLSRVALTGYSLGGFSALAMGAVGSDKVEISHINADEVPSRNRNPKQLRKDFMKSGGPKEQRQAIEDAKLPALSQALNIPRLTADYIRFGLTDVVSAVRPSENKALHHAMAGSVGDKIRRSLVNNPDTTIKIGHVEGSHLFKGSIETITSNTVRVVTYTGEGSHLHPTGDNPIAHALMAKDGIGRI